MADTFNIISIVSYTLAIIFIVITVFMFIKFKIPAVLGYLTGSTAKKSIESIWKENHSNLHNNLSEQRTELIKKEETELINKVKTELLNKEETELLNKEETAKLTENRRAFLH